MNLLVKQQKITNVYKRNYFQYQTSLAIKISAEFKAN